MLAQNNKAYKLLLLVFVSTVLIWHFRRVSVISPAQQGYLLPLHAIENPSRTFQVWSPPDSEWSKHKSLLIRTPSTGPLQMLIKYRGCEKWALRETTLRLLLTQCHCGEMRGEENSERQKGGFLLTNLIKDSWSPWEKQTLLLG